MGPLTRLRHHPFHSSLLLLACAAVLAPATPAATQQNSTRSALGLDFQSASAVALPGAGVTVTPSFGCIGDCGLAATRYVYFLTIQLGSGWQPTQPLTFTIHAPFDPSLSANNTLAFGLIDSPTAAGSPGTDVAACVAAQTACLDGFLAAAQQTAAALTFTLRPSYTFNGSTIALQPGDQLVLYATSFLPPDCSVSPPQPISPSDWTCAAQPLLDLATGSVSLSSQSAFAPALPVGRQRFHTPSQFFTAGALSSARSDSPAIAVPDPQGNTLLWLASTVRCFSDPAAAVPVPCGQSFQPASPSVAALQPSEYLYLYTITFDEPWTSAINLNINAPFDPAMSREFGWPSIGIFQDALLASNPGGLVQNFPPAVCAVPSPPGAPDCVDSLLALPPFVSSPLVLSLSAPASGFQAGDTVVLFATSFYPPAGCAFTAGQIQNCFVAAPLAVTTIASSSPFTASAQVLGPSIAVPPMPVLLSLTPDSIASPQFSPLPVAAVGATPAGSSTLTQLNFVAGSQILWNGRPVLTTFQNDGLLAAQIPLSDLAIAGPVTVTVRNPPLNPSDPGQSSSSIILANDSGTLPAIASLSPSCVVTGSPGLSLSVIGANFVNGSVVQFGATNATTTFGSDTELTANIPAFALVSSGTLPISVVNPSGGGTSNTMLLTVASSCSSVPVLSGIMPASATVGSSAVMVSLSGSGFATTSTAQFNGAGIYTQFVSGTALTATIPSTVLQTAGIFPVTVFDPVSGGTSAALNFTVANPLPVLSSLSQMTVVAGSPSFPLTLTGINFVNGCTVMLNSATLSPTFNNSTSLTVMIPASAVQTAGTSLQIFVFNPAPGGGTSNAATLQVVATLSLPTLVSISPTSAVAGGAGFTLTVTGTNFAASAAVQINTVPVATTFVSNTSLTAAVPASAIASAGPLSITVLSPSPSGATSNSLPLQVSNPVPALSSLSPPSALAGSAPFTLTIFGTGFAVGASIQLNATMLTPATVTPTSLTLAIPAALVASAQTLSVTVTNPSPGGGTSTPLSFPVLNPVPALSSLSQTSVLAGSAGLNLVLTGTNFISASTVQVGATALNPAQATSTSLAIAIPANLLSSPGTLSITVSNPSPGGGASSALTLAVTDFSVATATGPQTVAAGQPAAFTINLSTQNGALPATISLSCTGAPTGAACAFSPSSFSPGAASGTSLLTITTTARSSLFLLFPDSDLLLPAGLLSLAACLLLASIRLRERRLPYPAAVSAVILALVFAACGGSSSTASSPPPSGTPGTGTPAGTYMITVTASSGTAAAHSTTVALQVN